MLKSGKKLTVLHTELDLDTGKEIVIDELKTTADFERHQRIADMIEAAENDHDYDDTELQRELLKHLMRDPRYAHLRGEIEFLLARVKTPEERKAEEARLEAILMARQAKMMKRMEPELQELDAQINMVGHEMIQALIDDPDLAPAHDLLREWQSKAMDASEGDPEMRALVDRVQAKLETIPAYQETMARAPPVPQGLSPGEKDEWITNRLLGALQGAEAESPGTSKQDAAHQERDMKEALSALGADNVLGKDFQDLFAAMGADNVLEKDIQDLFDNDPELADPLAQAEMADPEDPEEEFDFQELKKKIDELNKGESQPDLGEVTEEEKLNPELKAMVDKIMADPSLLQKMAMIKEALDETQRDLTIRVQPSAPDPKTLPNSQLTTYRQRLKIAENTPEHIAGLRRLRINLLPPFNVSPALRSLNQALKLAYLGASDDVRRILWRAYNKARVIPTLLQSIPDDAWDILWYSQAVTWRSNQNRTNHLRILLRDLESVGRDGPPTHPDALEAD
jgi:hypothetical protein